VNLGEASASQILRLLRGLPGVVRAALLSDGQKARTVELEARGQAGSVIPVRNIGVALVARRDACFVLLKDGGFRPPTIPTVYLVEDNAGEDAAHVITVEGARYAVVGEEVIPGHAPYTEAVIPLDDSFVIFPDRRSGARVPCSFMLPPLGFAELEREADALGIGDIISISPSLVADTYLREAFGFPPTNDLATLLVACSPA
jgi:hypothetical protein